MEYKTLLNSISSITKKYDEIAKITGENFNIFSILRMESNEVKTHSAFIGELLNPKGSHGLGDIPLKLFITYVEELLADLPIEKEITENFKINTKESRISIEESNKIINDDGGLVRSRMDLVIKDNLGKVIVIENKIYAPEGDDQLFKYHEVYPNAPILFLTLEGIDAESANGIKLNEQYFLISYKEDILKWLEQCVKEAVYYPMLREVINQYINLIKKLTNQTTNKKMENELNIVIRNNYKASKMIYNQFLDARKTIIEEIFRELEVKLISEEKLKKWKIERVNNLFKDSKYYVLAVSKNEKLNMYIRYNILKQDNKILMGFVITPEERNKTKIENYIKDIIRKNTSYKEGSISVFYEEIPINEDDVLEFTKENSIKEFMEYFLDFIKANKDHYQKISEIINDKKITS